MKLKPTLAGLVLAILTSSAVADLPSTVARGQSAITTAGALASQPRLNTTDISGNAAVPNMGGTNPTNLDYNDCRHVSWHGGPAQCPGGYVFIGANRRSSDSGEWNSFTCCRLN